jgi:S1-C subfamily serine protease
MKVMRLFSKRALVAVLSIASMLAIACGSSADIDATVDARIQTAIAEIPTATPQPTATAQPTATPHPAAEPTPTAAPAATPQPTATPFPTATPQPTATPFPTATPVDFALATPTAIPVPSDLYAGLRMSVVRVSAGEAYGSGWAIEEGWIITNEHVVSGRTTVTVEMPLPNGGVISRTGTVRGVDTTRDLAAVQVQHNAPVLPRRIVTALDSGEPVVQMGYSVAAVGGYPVIHYGIITTVIRHLGAVLDDAPDRADRGDDSEGVGVVVFDAAADPGDSGGPVLDLEGNVVAITFGAIVSTAGGKRVIGQQQGTAVESIERVWDGLKAGDNTSLQ